MYQLEKYTNRESRHTCPQCGDRHSFAYYVDDDGVVLDERVGRCNHESGCGYHYTPKQYFQDNPDIRTQKPQTFTPVIIQKQATPDFIPFDTLWATCKNGVGRNDLMYFIWNLFDYDKTEWSDTITNRLANEYGIGTYGNDAVFWQIDINGNIRTGKIMKYQRNGHRVKADEGDRINWVHAKMKSKGTLHDNFNMVQCLFGEHLLAKYPSKKVALVESEKTALLGSAQYANYVWVATGGKNTRFDEKCMVLKGRDVVMFPDIDGYNDWLEKSTRMATYCNSVKVCNLVNMLNIDELNEVAAWSDTPTSKLDIGDWIVASMLKEKVAKAERKPQTDKETLDCMAEYNPAITELVSGLELVLYNKQKAA